MKKRNKKPRCNSSGRFRKKLNSNMFLKAVFLPDESGADPTVVNSFEFVTGANFWDFYI